ncbi:hypothetical protein [Photobacterium swingsii]|uniref:hypothetical protein n=1 Tax=Photobacterium swingsii TaxID=680026 RepID=UPI001364BB8F|nr:hypothetical protein [Photobacterium swingsii]
MKELATNLKVIAQLMELECIDDNSKEFIQLSVLRAAEVIDINSKDDDTLTTKTALIEN